MGLAHMMVLFLAHGLVYSARETSAPHVTVYRHREWANDSTPAHRKASSDTPYFDHSGDYKPPFVSQDPYI